jgi:hypothetical protein
MTYWTQNIIAGDSDISGRVSQCASSEGAAQSDQWTFDNRRVWASAPGWDAAWESALASHPDDPEYSPGADGAVITDGMILSQVQAMLNPSG